jgi:NADH-quinone oxidoreductase subunit M
VLLGAMAVLVLAIGVYPKPFTDAINPTSQTLLAQTNRSAQPVEAASLENRSGLPSQVRETVAANPVHSPG